MLSLLKYLDGRLAEPSTYASIAVMLALLHVNVDPGTLKAAALWGGVGSGVLGVVLAEVGTKSVPQIASDAFASFVAALKATPPRADPPAV
jgi:hypothetical protein